MEGKKILVIEDEYSINDALSFSLRREGYEVRSAYNGRDGLTRIKEFKPDLVLLDLMLGDIDGFDICKEVSGSTYVIMLTARGDTIDRIVGLELGVDDYIVKPFEIKEVIARVKAVFRRIEKEHTKNKDTEVIINNDIKINLGQRVLIKDDEKINLRKKEFDLVAFLFENRGNIVTRDILLERVWGYDYEGDTRTIDVHIRRIREKLKEDKENSIIETVFGLGYVMR
jgi:DNA-binding response OmpR family regulator